MINHSLAIALLKLMRVEFQHVFDAAAAAEIQLYARTRLEAIDYAIIKLESYALLETKFAKEDHRA